MFSSLGTLPAPNLALRGCLCNWGLWIVSPGSVRSMWGQWCLQGPSSMDLEPGLEGMWCGMLQVSSASSLAYSSPATLPAWCVSLGGKNTLQGLFSILSLNNEQKPSVTKWMGISSHQQASKQSCSGTSWVSSNPIPLWCYLPGDSVRSHGWGLSTQDCSPNNFQCELHRLFYLCFWLTNYKSRILHLGG